MSSGCPDLPSQVNLARVRWAPACALLALTTAAAPAGARELRVCADPNNLPFSNARGEGFENRIVDLIARDLRAEIRHVWWAQRRGFIRPLREGECDLIPGVASGVESLGTTAPYYRSSYVFLTRPGEPVPRSFDDPALRQERVGVQIVGDDGSNTPPAHALSRRGIVGNVRGYTLYGDYGTPNPPSAIVRAVADREVDVAVVWGPLAGYFGPRQSPPLRLAPVQPIFDGAGQSMVFDISMGTRKQDTVLRGEVETALTRNRSAIDAILTEYGVPRADGASVQARAAP